ncbi:MAG: protocatechuate 3,4-dioxygenase subunit beta, partial [Rhodospirillales bacterium]|nr:protocatechuate 3,4-dioxygenase subunit beta [Rhodospirillales bacterium]
YHPHGEAPAGGDPGFQGFGRAVADVDGRYRFRTIKPVPYSSRTPHVHFKIAAQGFPGLATQMYVAGHPMNARDFVLRRIRDDRARARVIVPLVAGEVAEPGALAARFDIVL